MVKCDSCLVIPSHLPGCSGSVVVFNTKLRGWLFIACQVISMCMCFVSVIFAGSWGICE